MADSSLPSAQTATRAAPRHVFVLGTGRCGSVTFAKACEHLTNFSTGHESRSQLVGAERLAYPDGHIEVDNRLSWFLGSLGSTFPDDRTFYVHLRRDPQLVVESFMRRWDSFVPGQHHPGVRTRCGEAHHRLGR